MNLVRYDVVWRAYEVKPLIQIDKMYTFFFQHLKEGHSFSGETHDFWEGLYVISGKLCVTADERVFTLSSGGIVFHKPLELHKFTVESENGADLLIFTYNASGALAGEMGNKTLVLNSFQRGIVEDMYRNMLRVCKNTKAERPEKRFINAHLLFLEKPEFLQMTAAYISQLIISLSGEESQYTAPNSQSAMIFSKAVDYMYKKAGEKIYLSDIASHVNASESSLKRIFLKYTNMGVHKYFLLLKIQTATRLLRSGSTVGEVTEALGFSSQGYFSACYKRETGKNPSEEKE